MAGDEDDVITRAQWDARETEINAQAERLVAAEATMKALQDSLAVRPKSTVTETKIPSFSGLSDDRSAALWLQKVDSIAAQFGYDDVKYIESASNALTKEAETWITNLRFRKDLGTCNTLSNKDEFRKAFLTTFDTDKVSSEQAATLGGLRQKRDERVRSFWLRVVSECNVLVQDYFQAKQYVIQAPTTDADGVLNDDGSRDFYIRLGIVDFVEVRIRDIHFLNGLKPQIADRVRPRLREISAGKGVTMLDLAEGAENNLLRESALGISSIEGSSKAEIAAYNSWKKSTGAGSKKQSSGNGGGQQQRGGQASRSSPRLFKIQQRKRPMFCAKCKQWGKHYTHECRRDAAQIAALAPMDQNAAPSEATDSYFDPLASLPDTPTNQGN